MIEQRGAPAAIWLAGAPLFASGNGSVDEVCLLQGGQDERDEDELGDDAGDGGEQRTGQERREREGRAGQTRQHEPHGTPDQTARYHGGDEGGIHHGQRVPDFFVHPACHSAVGGQLKGHGDGDGVQRRHPEQHRAQQRREKAQGQAPGAAQHEAGQQHRKGHGAEHVADLGHMAGDHGQDEGQRQKQRGQNEIPCGRVGLGVHEWFLLWADKKGACPGIPRQRQTPSWCPFNNLQ